MKRTPRIPIQLFKDGVHYKDFDSLKECHEYFRSFLPPTTSNKAIYDIINLGIDEDKVWEGYEFKTSQEIKEQRANRKTRLFQT